MPAVFMPAAPVPAMMLLASTHLIRLAPVDIAILLLYFAMVIFIGFYVKGVDQHQRAVLPGWARDDRHGSRASASSPPTSARSS